MCLFLLPSVSVRGSVSRSVVVSISVSVFLTLSLSICIFLSLLVGLIDKCLNATNNPFLLPLYLCSSVCLSVSIALSPPAGGGGSGVVGLERGETPLPTFLHWGNAFPHYV